MSSLCRACTLEYRGKSAVLISDVTIGIAFDTELADIPSLCPFKAIWDTGATASVISAEVVRRCGLRATGMTEVHTASDDRWSNAYLVSMKLPNNVGFNSLRVTLGKVTGADVLIGMDVIGQGDFAVTNYRGRTVFSYRYPSMATIDFVTELEHAEVKVGPIFAANAPCPCGSGRRFKNCHGQDQ